MGDRLRTLVGAAVLLAMADVHALSLGAARGEAVVGQPLELGFELALDAGTDVNAACVTAELFYGDTRIDASRVRIVTRQGSQPLQATVQLSSNVAVNEPVVSVLLRAGCSPAISRRFVLLSSSPVEAAGAAAAGVTSLNSSSGGSVRNTLPTQMPPPVVVAPRSTATTAPTGDAFASTRASARSTAPAPVKELAPRRPASPATTTAAAAPPSAPRGGARLELQSPVDWLQEQVLPLRSSTTMAEPPVTTTAEQRAAAAALWRSLGGAEGGAPPADAESQQRTQALENQVKTLQSNARLVRAREADLQNQLAEARSSAEFFWLAVWSTLGLVVAGGAIGGLLAWRRRGGRDMRWRKVDEPSVFGADAVTAYGEGFVDTQPAPVDFPYPTTLPEAPTGAPRPAPAFQGVEEPVQRTQQNVESGFGSSGFTPDEAPGRSPPTSAEAATRAARELRNGSANDLADVQQNADFFASLGQYEQAIELLQEYIASHPGTSPIAYLDLLKLFHTLSQTEPYRTLRTDFNAVFNADVPPFAAFLKGSKDLTAYNDVLQRISQAWSQASVLDLIESLLVRHSGEGAHPPFQLEAYRDLLLLYEIAKIEHGVDTSVKLSVPPGLAAAHVPVPPAVMAPAVTVAAAATTATAAEAVEQNSTATRPGVSLEMEPAGSEPDYPMSPISATNPDSGPDDLGIPLEFGSVGLPPELPRISLDDIAAPENAVSNRSGEPAAADPHLIDFDMFDVALPPPPERPVRR